MNDYREMTNAAIDAEGNRNLEHFFETEDWILEIFNKQDKNFLTKQERINFQNILNIPRKELNLYVIARFRASQVDEFTLKAIGWKAGIDNLGVDYHNGNFYVPIKRGKQLDAFRRLIDNPLDLAVIREEYNEYINSQYVDKDSNEENDNKGDEEKDSEGKEESDKENADKDNKDDVEKDSDKKEESDKENTDKDKEDDELFNDEDEKGLEESKEEAKNTEEKSKALEEKDDKEDDELFKDDDSDKEVNKEDKEISEDKESSEKAEEVKDQGDLKEENDELFVADDSEKEPKEESDKEVKEESKEDHEENSKDENPERDEDNNTEKDLKDSSDDKDKSEEGKESPEENSDRNDSEPEEQTKKEDSEEPSRDDLEESAKDASENERDLSQEDDNGPDHTETESERNIEPEPEQEALKDEHFEEDHSDRSDNASSHEEPVREEAANYEERSNDNERHEESLNNSYSGEPSHEEQARYEESSNKEASNQENISHFEEKNVYESQEDVQARIDDLRQNSRDGILDAETHTVGSGADIPQDYEKNYNNSRNDPEPNNNNEPDRNNFDRREQETNKTPESSGFGGGVPTNSENNNSGNTTALEYSEKDLGDRKNYKDERKEYGNRNYETGTLGYLVGLKETDVYKGAHAFDEVKNIATAKAYHTNSKARESILYDNLTRQQFDPNCKRDYGLNTLNDFLKTNGYKEASFATKKQGIETINNFQKVLCDKGLSKYDPQTKTYDNTKFFDEYKKIEKYTKPGFQNKLEKLENKGQDKNKASQKYRNLKNKSDKDLAEFAKKMGMTDKDPRTVAATAATLVKFANKEQKKEQTKKSGKQDTAKVKKTFVLYGKKDTDVYKGYQAIQNACRRTKDTIKKVRTTLKFAVKTVARSAYGVVAIGAAFAAPLTKGNSLKAVKGAKKKYLEGKQNLKDKLALTAQKAKDKLTLKEKREKFKNKRKERLAQTRIGQMFSRVFKSKLFLKMKTFGAGVGKFFRFLQLANPLNWGALLKAQIKKMLMKKLVPILGAVGGLITSFGGAVVIIVVIISCITGFFTNKLNDLKDWLTSITEESDMGRVYQALIKQQDKWLEKMTDTEVSNGFFSRGSLRFTKDYLTAEEYYDKISNHIVGYSNGAYTANPFDFESDDEYIYKTITKFDGGTEVYLEAQNGTSVSNIKDILCMTNEFFGLDTVNASDNKDSSKADGADSPETGNSGEGYSSIDDSEISRDDDTANVSAMKRYAKELFKSSHRQYVELEYLVLPTAYTAEKGAESEAQTIKANLYSSNLVEQCTGYDEGGCTEYKNFYYAAVKDKGIMIAAKAKDGSLRPLADVVKPEDDSCRPNNGYSDTTLEYLNAVLGSNENCYNISSYGTRTSSGGETSSRPSVSDTASEAAKGVLRQCGVIGGVVPDVTSVSFDCNSAWDGALNYRINWSYETVKEDTRPEGTGKYIDAVTGEELESTDPGAVEVTEDKEVYWTETTSGTVDVVWDCKGGHVGHFCGGHLKANVTSMIYSIPVEKIEGEDGAFYNAEEGRDGELHTFTSYDEAALQTATDIFDIDKAIKHSTETEDWEGWTESNMELACLQYDQDWEEMYGFDVEGITKGTGGALGNPFKCDWTSYITSYYGYRSKASIAGAGAGATTSHLALDIGLPAGTEIYSVCDGYVSSTGWSDVYGYAVTVDIVNSKGDPTGWQVTYKHIPKDMGCVVQGQEVKKGDQIGVIGGVASQSSEYFGGTASTGAHLHIELYDGNSKTYQNPLFYLSSYVEPSSSGEEETE